MRRDILLAHESVNSVSVVSVAMCIYHPWCLNQDNLQDRKSVV